MAASASANELSVETRRAGAHTIVIVTGRVTVDSSPHLRPVLHEAIGAAPPAGVVIDFTAARYLDTSAIATLLEAATPRRSSNLPRTSSAYPQQLRVPCSASRSWHGANGLPVEQRDVAGVVNGLGDRRAVRHCGSRLVTDMELELGRGTVPLARR